MAYMHILSHMQRELRLASRWLGGSWLAAALVAPTVPQAAPAQPGDAGSDLLTRAERTGYRETTAYHEVVQLVERAAALSDRVHATSFGTTVEGRPLPLVVVGDVPDARPASVMSAGRIRIWLQANIHGGEVCGKEALLMLLRALVNGRHAEWRSSLILLISPIYNADGNERMALDNRPYQLGPVGGMGTRRNVQGLDLNRDHMKLESPEARALVRAYTDYDPHVVIDLHTTNGTQHAYHLTYAPPLHRLVFALLEPRSDDGVVNWNLLDEPIETDPVYPILRVPAEP